MIPNLFSMVNTIARLCLTDILYCVLLVGSSGGGGVDGDIGQSTASQEYTSSLTFLFPFLFFGLFYHLSNFID